MKHIDIKEGDYYPRCLAYGQILPYMKWGPIRRYVMIPLPVYSHSAAVDVTTNDMVARWRQLYLFWKMTEGMTTWFDWSGYKFDGPRFAFLDTDDAPTSVISEMQI